MGLLWDCGGGALGLLWGGEWCEIDTRLLLECGGVAMGLTRDCGGVAMRLPRGDLRDHSDTVTVETTVKITVETTPIL